MPKPTMAPVGGSLVAHGGLPVAAQAHETCDLPPILAMALWPWTDIVETATGRMGDAVRLTAENTVANLRRRIVLTSRLETAMEDALVASDALAHDLDQCGSSRLDMRMEALIALNALIWRLGSAKPTKQTKGMGLGW
ncbi:MAG: hypothetical protein ABW003_22505 [Microvirga sp.]